MSIDQAQPSPETAVVHLSERTFDESLATGEGVWMVDFWASWCRPCLAIAPVLEELALASKGDVTLAKVNVDEEPLLAARYGIRSIPTVLFFRDGQLLDQVVGGAPKADIQARLAALAGPRA